MTPAAEAQRTERRSGRWGDHPPRTVLIFAHECAPFHRRESMVAGQRPAQFAKHLPAFGWRAIVLCCDARERGTGSPAEVGTRVVSALRAASPGESVVIPTPSLPWDGVLDRAWRRASLGSTALHTALRKVLTGLKLTTGDYSQGWQPCARAAAAAVVAETRIDACVGAHTPDAGLFLGRWFSDSFGVPWVADFRDFILQPIAPMLRAPYARFARRLVRTAEATINVTPYWTELDEELFGLPAATIPNGFDPDEFPALRRSVRGDRLTIAYNGNLIPQMRMRLFLEGLAALRDRGGEDAFRSVRFTYRGLAEESVRRWAEEVGVGEIVESGPMIPRARALESLQHADLLLLLSIANPEREDYILGRGLYPAKTFEYFGARRPILCVPGDRGLLDDLIIRTGTGVILRTPEALADHLVAVLRRWSAGESPSYEPDEAEVSRYSRIALTRQLATLLDRAVDDAAGARSPAARRAGSVREA